MEQEKEKTNTTTEPFYCENTRTMKTLISSNINDKILISSSLLKFGYGISLELYQNRIINADNAYLKTYEGRKHEND